MVDGVVDEGAAGVMRRVGEPARVGGPGPRLRQGRAERKMRAEDTADLARTNPLDELLVPG